MMSIERLTLENLRQEYASRSLSEQDVHADPLFQFEVWFKEALKAGISEPNAMTLSCVSPEGRPSSRVMLLKGFDEHGFTFYTNYLSRKGQQLAWNSYACLSFFWLDLQRQVIIEGQVEKTSEEEATRYFQSRPMGSQLGAWVSRQSEVIAGRDVLIEKLTSLESEYAGRSVLPKPDYWGGYLLKPDRIEFWQGRPNRLHDRIQYRRKDSNQWNIERLSP